jgi:hypothetical protein
VFFGVPGHDGTQYGGTGFLVCDPEDGIQIPFLVTARHVAKELEAYEDTGFFVRVNRMDGSGEEIPVQDIHWSYHPDPTVDLAATVFVFPAEIYDAIYFPLRGRHFENEDRIAPASAVICGDEIAIVGLFRLHFGKKRNVPITHSGHVAALPHPDERIPIRNRKTQDIVESEAYLVEAQTLEGLSGSPVFIRETIAMDHWSVHGQHPLTSGAMRLLGLYVGAWDAEPGHILALDRNLRGGLRVPVGVGTVVPAVKIIELIRGDERLVDYRKRRAAYQKTQNAATEDSAFPPPPSAGLGPPTKAIEGDDQHKERFTALLDAAVGKPKQGG